MRFSKVRDSPVTSVQYCLLPGGSFLSEVRVFECVCVCRVINRKNAKVRNVPSTDLISERLIEYTTYLTVGPEVSDMPPSGLGFFQDEKNAADLQVALL